MLHKLGYDQIGPRELQPRPDKILSCCNNQIDQTTCSRCHSGWLVDYILHIEHVENRNQFTAICRRSHRTAVGNSVL